MSLLDHLCDNGAFRRWELNGRDLPDRYFWYSGRWADAFNSLDAGDRRGRLAKDTSEKGRVSGLINEFVAGTPRARLVTPVGYGADPVAKRLNAPREAVVYFRTNAPSGGLSIGVRCFGLFRSPNVFFAMSMMRKAVRTGEIDPVDLFVDPIMVFLGRVISEVDMTTHVDNLITP